MKIVVFVCLLFGSIGISTGQETTLKKVVKNGYTLYTEYNVMSNVVLEKPRKFKNKKRYKFIEEGIYLDLKEKDMFKHRMTISYEQNTEKNQYPLEDILDEYLVYVVRESRPKKNKFKIEFGGDLKDMIRIKKELIGKTIFNRDSLGKNNKIYTILVAE